MKVHPVLVAGAKILIVGEAPGSEEERQGVPFVGASGALLTSMLHDAGILRTECSITNVTNLRPPNNEIEHFFLDKKLTCPGPEIAEGMAQLKSIIERAPPNLIIALGRTALWALTGESSINNWRGSIMPCTLVPGVKVLPTYHPAAVMRVWEWKTITTHDLRRAKYEAMFPEIKRPEWNFLIAPSFETAMSTLDSLKGKRLAADIETIARHIACVGFAWSKQDAICIPFAIQGGKPYWTEAEEIAITMKIQEVLETSDIIWQNGLYDTQHFAKHLGIRPNHSNDTMIAQSVLFPGLPKALDFISSMYCERYYYWKDDLKDYHRYPVDIVKFWNYNAMDCCRTFECFEVEEASLRDAGLLEQYQFQIRLTSAAFRTMLRGIAINRKYKNDLAGRLMETIEQLKAQINFLVGHPINISSPKQMQALFYQDLKFPVQKSRKSGNPTLDDKALANLAMREPLIRGLVDLIQITRSLGVFLNTFVLMPLDTDGRMRTSFNPAGTETFRFSSSEDAFGSGGNLQNIPRNPED